MNPIAILFGFVLLAISIFFVASPFRLENFQKKAVGKKNQQVGIVKLSAEKQRQAVLLALRDLDFDYQANKVAEEDYQTLRAELLSEAAQLLQNQDQQKEDTIEALIQSRRKAKAVTPKVSPPQPQKGQVEALCQNCQAPLPEDARFCSKCGQPIQAGDIFCRSCGAAVGLKAQTTNSRV
jgi:ribosomal protein L40E